MPLLPMPRPRAAEAAHVRRTLLPGGLRVVTEFVPSVRSASVGVWVNVGSRDEPTSVAGAAHFLEHLLFKATPTRGSVEIAQSVELNLAMDLQRQGKQIPADDPKLGGLRADLDREVRAESAREQEEIFKGLAAGSVALLISLMQMIWLRRTT